MDETKKKARIWFFVLLLAILVIAGICIYLYGTNHNNYSNEGTLIIKIFTIGDKLWQ